MTRKVINSGCTGLSPDSPNCRPASLNLNFVSFIFLFSPMNSSSTIWTYSSRNWQGSQRTSSRDWATAAIEANVSLAWRRLHSCLGYMSNQSDLFCNTETSTSSNAAIKGSHIARIITCEKHKSSKNQNHCYLSNISTVCSWPSHKALRKGYILMFVRV